MQAKKHEQYDTITNKKARMTRLEAITEAYLIATGKTTLPAEGSSKRNKLTGLAKKLYRDWQVEKGVEWSSLYAVVSGGTVSATDTFELDTDINFISKQEGNFVRIRTAPNSYVNYILCKPQQLYQYRDGNYVAKVADNSVKFSKAFTASDSVFGGTIEVPAIIKLDDINSDTSEILIDNPQWLPARLAAQYVFNDRQLNYLYDDLLADANDMMQGMIDQNGTLSDSYNTGIDYFSSMGSV